jgi:hypothetical protein
MEKEAFRLFMLLLGIAGAIVIFWAIIIKIATHEKGKNKQLYKTKIKQLWQRQE